MGTVVGIFGIPGGDHGIVERHVDQGQAAADAGIRVPRTVLGQRQVDPAVRRRAGIPVRHLCLGCGIAVGPPASSTGRFGRGGGDIGGGPGRSSSPERDRRAPLAGVRLDGMATTHTATALWLGVWIDGHRTANQSAPQRVVDRRHRCLRLGLARGHLPVVPLLCNGLFMRLHRKSQAAILLRTTAWPCGVYKMLTKSG